MLLGRRLSGLDKASVPPPPATHARRTRVPAKPLALRRTCGAQEGEGPGDWQELMASARNSLARLLTPFCRALMRWKRPPLWIFDGNREGSGKDTCANLTFILYTGHPLNGVPTGKDSEDELRKRITSSLISGARFFHLANIKNG